MPVRRFISKEHRIVVSADHLNKIIQMDRQYFQKLSEIGVKSLNIVFEHDSMIVSGEFDKDKWKGEFKIILKPDRIIWDKKHILFIQILDHNVQFEKSFHGILANIGNVVIESVFGKNFILSKIVARYENDLIQIDLDSAGERLNKVLDSVIINDVRCEKDKLIILIQPNPKQAAKNAGGALKGWLKHKLSEG